MTRITNTHSKPIVTKHQAHSLFERLQLEHGTERAQKMLTMVLQNAELWQKLSRELYIGKK